MYAVSSSLMDNGGSGAGQTSGIGVLYPEVHGMEVQNGLWETKGKLWQRQMGQWIFLPLVWSGGGWLLPCSIDAVLPERRRGVWGGGRGSVVVFVLQGTCVVK